MSTYNGNPSGAIVTSTTLPDDATSIEASDVNVPLETIFDNFARLQMEVAVVDVRVRTPIADTVSGVGATYLNCPTVYVDVPGVKVGDVVVVDVSLDVQTVATSGSGEFAARAAAIENFGGTTTTTTVVPGTTTNLYGVGAADGTSPRQKVTMNGAYTATVAGTARIMFQVQLVNSSASLLIKTAGSMRATRYSKVP